MILWSASSIGKRVSLLGVLVVSVWLLTGTPANGQAATTAATSTAPTKTTIQAAQKHLLALGYQPGTADGVMGTKAIAAVKKFQADRSLPVTGQLDRKTLDALNAEGAKAPNVGANKDAAVEEKYEPVPVDDIRFFLDQDISSIEQSGRGIDVPGFDVVSVDGKCNRLEVGNNVGGHGKVADIELATNKLGAEHGYLTVETKRYGTIRFEIANMSSLRMWLKPSQKNALLEFLKSQPDFIAPE
jgi:hypothetical protein